MKAINLDALSRSELEALILDNDTPDEYVVYATLVLAAHDHRMAGRMNRALIIEQQADRLYDALPAELKW